MNFAVVTATSAPPFIRNGADSHRFIINPASVMEHGVYVGSLSHASSILHEAAISALALLRDALDNQGRVLTYV